MKIRQPTIWDLEKEIPKKKGVEVTVKHNEIIVTGLTVQEETALKTVVESKGAVTENEEI